jgi:hypothetical protein
MLAQNVDAWNIIRAYKNASIDTRNAAASAVSGVVNHTIRVRRGQKLTSDAAWTQLIIWMTIFHEWTLLAKKETGKKHEKQTAGQHLKENYVPWPEWVQATSAYIRKYFDTAPAAGRLMKKAPKGLDGLRDAVLLACYSLIAPIRNNWANVRIVRGAEPKKDENSVVINAEGAVTGVFWGDFKNSASFKGQLPIQTDTTAELRTMLAEWIRVNPSKTWLFPAKMKEDSNYITNFSTFFGNLTQRIVGKRVGVQVLRVAYIHWFHDTFPEAVKDVANFRRVLRNLHQFTFHTHLSYRKNITPEQEWAALQRTLEQEASGFYEAQQKVHAPPREPVPVIVLEPPAAQPVPKKKRTGRPKKVVITGTNPIMKEIMAKARALGARTVS